MRCSLQSLPCPSAAAVAHAHSRAARLPPASRTAVLVAPCVGILGVQLHPPSGAAQVGPDPSPCARRGGPRVPSLPGGRLSPPRQVRPRWGWGHPPAPGESPAVAPRGAGWAGRGRGAGGDGGGPGLGPRLRGHRAVPGERQQRRLCSSVPAAEGTARPRGRARGGFPARSRAAPRGTPAPGHAWGALGVPGAPSPLACLPPGGGRRLFPGSHPARRGWSPAGRCRRS